MDAKRRTESLRDKQRGLKLRFKAQWFKYYMLKSSTLRVNDYHLEHGRILPISLLSKTEDKDATIQGRALKDRILQAHTPLST